MVSCFGILQNASNHTKVELEYFKRKLEGSE